MANTPALYARAAEIGAVWVEDRDMQERHLEARRVAFVEHSKRPLVPVEKEANERAIGQLERQERRRHTR